MVNKELIAQWFEKLQTEICVQLEQADGKGKFKEDPWSRPGGGGGKTRIIMAGNIIEKGGVNFSKVHGATPEKILNALQLPPSDFFASGVSIVMHPFSPMVPIIHMNVRYFEMSSGTWWFGGGIDLTPHYVDHEDAAYFHRTLKEVCDQFHPDYYPRFKKWADDYFFIKHRKETRGVGGIFFDRLGEENGFDKEKQLSFVQAIGNAFAPIYTHIMKKNQDLPFGETEKNWQRLRRGRYVEFNLVYDRGTKFGLDTEGRTESILMSLPPQANWTYDHHPSKLSKEAETLALLKREIDWISG